MNGFVQVLHAIANAWRRQLAAFKRHVEKAP
jgi:uncharacterized protein YyaL (SSP411 family)